MTDKLKEIVGSKEKEIARLLPVAEKLRHEALLRNDFRSLSVALDRGEDRLGLLAEVKRASPSAGLIASDFDPLQIAAAYETSGAHAVSVLTDGPYFGGSLSDMALVRRSVGLPVIRKDFIVHEVQIFEAVCAGADAILLIVAALPQERLGALHRTALDLQLDVLVEVHTADELERALEIEPIMIGINNRNLATFEVDLATTESLSEDVPDGILLVSESGIKTGEDTRRLIDCGVNAILVGETLMRSPDIPAKIAELLHLEDGV